MLSHKNGWWLPLEGAKDHGEWYLDKLMQGFLAIVDDAYFESWDPVFFQMALSILAELFEHDGLKTNHLKMQAMVSTSGRFWTQLLTASYHCMYLSFQMIKHGRRAAWPAPTAMPHCKHVPSHATWQPFTGYTSRLWLWRTNVNASHTKQLSTLAVNSSALLLDAWVLQRTGETCSDTSGIFTLRTKWLFQRKSGATHDAITAGCRSIQ
jgi:hypothetical protein